jgi:putative sugar O-methyltransferase|tara:strand:- start:7711 stop:8496 length:786 start_codon:yes stop_codon:yes gene_type:complete
MNNVIGTGWQELNVSHKKELDENGYEYFRERIAKHYMTEAEHNRGDHIYQNNDDGINDLYEYLINNGIEIDISDTQIGGGAYMKDHNDNLITMDLLISLWEINRMEKVVDFNKIKSVTEIGAGYGRTLHAILKKYPHLKCDIIDIEPAMNVSKHYLKETLPSANITWNFPEQIDKLTDVDLVYCISGFCEMPMDIVKIYFDYVNKNSKYFYFKHDRQCGHYPERNKSMYPIREHWEQIFSSNCPITPRFYEELYSLNKNHN